MAQRAVILSAVFDDVTNVLTVIGRPQPPDRPEGVAEDDWYPQSGAAISFDVPAKRLDTEPPRATYIVADSDPPEMRQVEFRSGAWQFPGVRVN